MQIYLLNVTDLTDGRIYDAFIEASSIDEAVEKAMDFYCYSLDCCEEAIKITLKR